MFVKYNEMQPVRKQCVNDTTIVNTLISKTWAMSWLSLQLGTENDEQ